MQLSSINKSILVTSDVHQEVGKLEKILKAECPDITVILGDWYDSHVCDEASDVEATNEFLKKRIFDKDFVTLWGNHDMGYWWPYSRAISCSGFSPDKKRLIEESFGPKMEFMRRKFQWFLWIDDFLCSHAGLHPRWISPMQSIEKDKLDTWLKQQQEFAEHALINEENHWMFGSGWGRGGRMPVGGLTWLDFRYEFEPIEGLKQLVGHTATRNGIRGHGNEGVVNVTEANNLCLDCHMNEYLIINNGKLTIKKYADL